MAARLWAPAARPLARCQAHSRSLWTGAGAHSLKSVLAEHRVAFASTAAPPTGSSLGHLLFPRALLKYNTASGFFSASQPYSRSVLLADLLAKFKPTRAPGALRNTYFPRSRAPASRGSGSGGYYGNNSGGGGGGGGLPFWRRLRAFINSLPNGFLVWGIIGWNAAVFLLWQYAEQTYRQFKDPALLAWMYQNFTTSWENLRQGRVWTLLTSAFSHSTSGHILMNLLTFYFFAPLGASVLGNVPFLGLYLGGAILSSVVSLVWNKVNPKPGPPRPSHGASGGINAVLAFFACAFPRATVYVFFIVPLPSWVAIGGLIGWDFYNAVVQRQGNVVDSAGHLGGALGGALFFLRWRLGRGLF